ncbi:MAG: hypothetical protein JWM64_477 [Frankiales bacterium]|nr:hypothetical protein [Frankiales bacterium]
MRRGPSWSAPPVTDLDARVLAAHDGEVMGAALFSALAARTQVPREVELFGLLAQVEEVTREVLAPVLRRRSLVPSPSADGQGRELADELAGLPHEQLWTRMTALVEPALRDYQDLRAASDTDLEALDRLVAHEQALRDVCRLELAGTPSTAPLLAYLEAQAS